jgi:hypothetical protein
MVSTSLYGDKYLTRVFRVQGKPKTTDAAKNMDTTDSLDEIGTVGEASDLQNAELNNARLIIQIIQNHYLYNPRVVFYGKQYS